ncbi:Alpha/Beta hydrolase protein [Podospora appendiculata]|uniref:Alpha/Beta hydrolase protein n=1 Tax=Podospora appendiculata TaxID=314037 RepID=A0AAE0WYR0_9PEZI|nr:Alpha/Beta hydrolase protein [Podospora appendiculata]
MPLPHIVNSAAGYAHTHTIILLHGRDSDAEEFALEFFECEESIPDNVDATNSPVDRRTIQALFPTVRWVFPPAEPLRSERFGVEISQWFDMWAAEDPQARSQTQLPGLQASVGRLCRVVEEEETLLPRSRIVLGGISQGFATALATLFADGRGGFAGLCGFSSWIPLADGTASAISQESPRDQLVAMQRMYGGSNTCRQEELSPLPQLTRIPILLEHCTDDGVIAVDNGIRMRETLLGLGFRDVEWREYDTGGHWINEPRGVDDLVRFLRRVMKTTTIDLSPTTAETPTISRS